MKKLFTLVALVLFSTLVVYNHTPTNAAEIPLTPELEAKFEQLQKKVVKSRWNATTQGLSSVGTYTIGPKLPANAVITDSYILVKTQLVDGAGAGSALKLAFHCEDAGNIMAETDISSHAAGVIIGGARYGMVAGDANAAAEGFADSIAAPCDITATVTGDFASAGELLIFTEYVVGQ